MNEDIRAFLSRFTLEELLEEGVLQPFRHMLRKASVDPLIDLMRENNISKLEYPQRHWFLTTDYQFSNPNSTEHTNGDVRQLSNPGLLFNEQNRYINPFFMTTDSPDGADIDEETLTFGLERDLQSALRSHIEQLEPGLKIIDGGTERTTAAGRIDITAEDKDGNLVVTELKAGTAPPGSLTQLLAYMGALRQEEQKPIRGMLVAQDFHQRVVWAAQAVPGVQLKEYSFRFSFQNR